MLKTLKTIMFLRGITICGQGILFLPPMEKVVAGNAIANLPLNAYDLLKILMKILSWLLAVMLRILKNTAKKSAVSVSQRYSATASNI